MDACRDVWREKRRNFDFIISSLICNLNYRSETKKDWIKSPSLIFNFFFIFRTFSRKSAPNVRIVQRYSLKKSVFYLNFIILSNSTILFVSLQNNKIKLDNIILNWAIICALCRGSLILWKITYFVEDWPLCEESSTLWRINYFVKHRSWCEGSPFLWRITHFVEDQPLCGGSPTL